MKIRLPVHYHIKDDYLILKATNKKDHDLAKKLLQVKQKREEAAEKEFFVFAELDLPTRPRTYKQNNAVWILVEAIFISMEGRKPIEEEKYGLYLDLLEVYADKVPCRFNQNLRPIRISESNTIEGARFIDGLLYHLSTECELEYDTQATVQSVYEEWLTHRGTLDIDPMDYSDLECTKLLTEKEWREKRVVSEASGKGGSIVLHHIVTRGSNKAAEDKAWNWIALTIEEHQMIHQKGNDWFLSVYPHLNGRFSRAKKLAGYTQGKKKEESVQSLVEAALNG